MATAQVHIVCILRTVVYKAGSNEFWRRSKRAQYKMSVAKVKPDPEYRTRKTLGDLFGTF
jgi:hypothetical protein